MSNKIPFLPPINLNGRNFYQRSRVEHYKLSLIAEALGHPLPDYVPPAVEEFVPSKGVTKELGCSLRTLGRRIAGISKSEAA